jgi:outer membrane lipoprotein-sorting protein
VKNSLLLAAVVTVISGLIAGIAAAAWVTTKGDDKEESTSVAIAETAAPTSTSEPALVLERLGSYQFVAEIARGTGSARVSSFMKGWFEVPYKTRWELGPAQPANYLFLRTEDGLWTYQPTSRTYTFQPGAVSLYKEVPQPLHMTYLVGSILPASAADDETLLLAATEELLGRTVAYLEVAGPLISGKRKLWVDVKNRLVLREEVLDHPTLGQYDARMIELSLNKDIDDAVFSFAPPPGSRQTNAGPSAQSNPGPLFPAYLPEGYQMRRSETSVTGTQFQVDTKVYEDRQGHSFLLNQEYKRGEPWTLADGEVAVVGRYSGRVIRVGAAASLVWIVGEIRISLTSSAVPTGELLRIGASMK